MKWKLYVHVCNLLTKLTHKNWYSNNLHNSIPVFVSYETCTCACTTTRDQLVHVTVKKGTLTHSDHTRYRAGFLIVKLTTHGYTLLVNNALAYHNKEQWEDACSCKNIRKFTCPINNIPTF